MTKPKPPKTKKLTVPKLKEIYGKKAPDYARRPKLAPWQRDAVTDRKPLTDQEADLLAVDLIIEHTWLKGEVRRLRALRDLTKGWLLTLEQEHEKASHQDEDTRQISSRTCHVCAGIDELWQSIKEGKDDEDPEVLKLVDSLADDAAAHPEKLGDVGDLTNDDDQCSLCVRGYAAIVDDFQELETKLNDPAQMRADFARLHGHTFDAPERGEHCHHCHEAGLTVRAAQERRRELDQA